MKKIFVHPDKQTLFERFMSQVDKSGDCWLWIGRMSPQGYGNTRVDGKSMGVHRLAYELFVGEIPAKAVVDHSCHNSSSECSGGWGCLHRRCVNPDHLEAVTQKENLKRSILTTVGRTHCKWGHSFADQVQTPLNQLRGQKKCRVCLKIRNDSRYSHAS